MASTGFILAFGSRLLFGLLRLFGSGFAHPLFCLNILVNLGGWGRLGGSDG
jgi:hypothetical protein